MEVIKCIDNVSRDLERLKSVTLNLYGGELVKINEIKNSDLPEAQKAEDVRKQLLVLLSRHEHSAKQILKTQGINDAIVSEKDSCISIVGGLIAADLNLLQGEGMDYKSLCYLFGAPHNVAEQIERDKETESKFADIVVKYHLGNYGYTEIETAIRARKEQK